MSTRLEATPVAATHLSEKQLGRLRRRLVEDHVVQRSRAVELQDPPDLEPDLVEILLARCRAALDEIEEALSLLDRGVYGLCTACGTAIPHERLEAVPAARRCVSCQTAQNQVLR